VCFFAANADKDTEEPAITTTTTTGTTNEKYNIEGALRLPKGARISQSRIFLRNGYQMTTFIRQDGSFTFHDVSPGSYILEILMVDYFFLPVRLDVSAREKGRVRASLLVPSSSSSQSLSLQNIRKDKLQYPLSLTPIHKPDYFQRRAPMNIMGMLKNPMVIMILITLVIVVVMPRMLANMDPADIEEMKRMQNNMSVNNLLKNTQQRT